MMSVDYSACIPHRSCLRAPVLRDSFTHAYTRRARASLSIAGWSDPGELKWNKLLEWREEFAQTVGKSRTPIIWLDKARLDTANH